MTQQSPHAKLSGSMRLHVLHPGKMGKPGSPGVPQRERGKHVWVVGGMFLVEPHPDHVYELCSDNAIEPDGPMCVWCEAYWTPELAKRWCPGRPE